MRFDRLLIVFTVAGSVQSENLVASTRQLQEQPPEQTLKYRANYSADFQYYTDPLCGGASPVLELSCVGSNMTILNTSDPSINCTLHETTTVGYGATFLCVNSCLDSACDDIYRITNDYFNPIEGPFGSIYFMCEGDTVEETEGLLIYQGGNINGTCAPSSSSEPSFGRNYHIGRMGISCPVGSGSLREYVYDDTYFDCISLGSFTLDLAEIEDLTDMFACVSGMRCLGVQCSFSFYNLWITSSLPDFFDTCVESLVGITPYPTKAPTSPSFKFTTQFEASWATFYSPLLVSSSCPASQTVATVLSCGNGAKISFVNGTGITRDNCAESGENKLSCISSGSATENGFVSVNYTCIGPLLPTSSVTFSESPISCNNNTVMATVQQVVTLGVLCEDGTSMYYYYNDLLFECAERNHNYDIIIDDYGIDGPRLACFESAVFPIGSALSDSKRIPSVSVTTDAYWLTGSDGRCFKRESVLSSPSAPTSNQPVTPSPTIITMKPTIRTVNPTLTPSDVETVKPIGVASIPTASPVVTKESGNSGSGVVIGGVVGGIVAGIVIMAVIGFFVMRNKQLVNSDDYKRRPSVTESGTIHGHGDPNIGGSSTASMPTTSLIHSRSSYNVTYKDQSRSVVDPAFLSHGSNIPIAVAVNAESSSVRSQSTQAQPPGFRFDL